MIARLTYPILYLYTLVDFVQVIRRFCVETVYEYSFMASVEPDEGEPEPALQDCHVLTALTSTGNAFCLVVFGDGTAMKANRTLVAKTFLTRWKQLLDSKDRPMRVVLGQIQGEKPPLSAWVNMSDFLGCVPPGVFTVEDYFQESAIQRRYKDVIARS